MSINVKIKLNYFIYNILINEYFVHLLTCRTVFGTLSKEEKMPYSLAKIEIYA